MPNLTPLTLNFQEHINQAVSVLNDSNLQGSEQDLVGVFSDLVLNNFHKFTKVRAGQPATGHSRNCMSLIMYAYISMLNILHPSFQNVNLKVTLIWSNRIKTRNYFCYVLLRVQYSGKTCLLFYGSPRIIAELLGIGLNQFLVLCFYIIICHKIIVVVYSHT